MTSFWHLGTNTPWGRADWLSFAQLVFTALGFIVAIYQIRRGVGAAEDARELLKSMRSRVLGNDLLVLLPELQRVEDDLDSAIKAGDPTTVERHLVLYARSASHIAELLRSQSDAEDERLVQLLTQCAAAATRAKAELAEGTTRPLGEVVRVAAGKVGRASVEISAATARLQRKVGD